MSTRPLRIWLQLLLGWLPVWALFGAMMTVVHGPMSLPTAAIVSGRSTVPAALLGILVLRLARRVPWPHPFRMRFALLHLAAAHVYAFSWMGASGIIESLIRGRLSFAAGPGVGPFLLLGLWLYVIVAGISYAIEATERAARAEATTARTQLAALRAQLHPHFLFNALHTVVQLIPVDPARAQEAAEQVAGLLRTTVEEDRDIVALANEWAFVSQYLELERIRFGERLRVHAALDPAVMDAPVPSFALQTLVENAVRHGAAPRVDPTDIYVDAAPRAETLVITVRDTGDGAPASAASNGSGTGLARLRERLTALYGGAARLELATSPGGGWTATLAIPRDAATTPDESLVNVTTLIADDEPVARAGLRQMLSAFDWITVIGEAANGPAAVEAIDALRPDLVLLDVQMPGLLGPDVLRRVTHQPYAVFTTAYSEHAVSAFELGALDYLLKPFGPTRLAAAMERVRAALGEPASHPALERLGDAMGKGPISRLFVRAGRSIVPVAVERVAWFEADGDYVAAHDERGRHLLHLSLSRLERRLDPRKFVRIHRGAIVNLDGVASFRAAESGRLVAVMKDGTRLTVSRARAAELRSLGL